MTKGGTVYLVDDDAAVRRGLDRLLRAAGYEVELLESGADYMAHSAPTRHSCLVLDIRMPRMTGLELQEAIAGTDHDRPIVFMTGHGDEDVRARALSSGASDVLFKPIDASVLIQAVERALAVEDDREKASS
jgi:FixJ family two-component response regulator